MKEFKNILNSLFPCINNSKNDDLIFIDAWNKVMYKFLDYVAIKSFQGNTLYVNVFDSRLLQELNLFSIDIKNYINKKLFEAGSKRKIEKILFFIAKKNIETKNNKNSLNNLVNEKNENDLIFVQKYLNKNISDDNMRICLFNIYKKCVN